VDPTMYYHSTDWIRSSTLLKSTEEQPEDSGPSFSLNLFTNGFTFGNADELYFDEPENLNPYNSQAESILRHIECGRLPTGIIHEDMQCEYVNGTVICEVCDYRVAIESPIVKNVALKTNLDNLIEDITSMFSKLHQDEQLKLKPSDLPHLSLDPTPTVDLFSGTVRVIDLGIDWGNNRRNKHVAGSESTELSVIEHGRSKPVSSVVEDKKIMSFKQGDVVDFQKQEDIKNQVADDSHCQSEDLESKD
ncbi:nuclear receptor coactivator 2-like protein isoform X2, partial [Tanacetum coccineum]